MWYDGIVGDIVIFWMVRWYSGTLDESGWHGGIVGGIVVFWMVRWYSGTVNESG